MYKNLKVGRVTLSDEEETTSLPLWVTITDNWLSINFNVNDLLNLKYIGKEFIFKSIKINDTESFNFKSNHNLDYSYIKFYTVCENLEDLLIRLQALNNLSYPIFSGTIEFKILISINKLKNKIRYILL